MVEKDSIGHKNGLGVDLVSGSGSKGNLGNEGLDGVSRLSKASLDKSLGKRPVGMDGNTNFNKDSMAILPIQIPSNDGALNSEHAGASFNLFDGASNQVFDAELWGILDGLKIVQRRGHVHVTIQSDSLEVVKSILCSSSTDSNSVLIRRICNILSQENYWILRHILREYNQVADCLAKQALTEKANLQVFDVPPEITSSFIDRDRHTGSFYA
ncbi:hypothetical protein J1N35_000301 [Gossypium stocksii]|uniref:RNase H type-1 domain-containing protein n=1 Tax=Gossypium stocksii TaxID=47602 RepID=A0A9D3WII3_9ROSI|nr:hypothetical protein J1N35_000301 [Gossypium stocksii]